MAKIPFELTNNSIIVDAQVNGQTVKLIVDTDDAIGPTFNAEDAQRLNLPDLGPLEVSGAGGSVQIAATTADITLGSDTFKDEPGAIDPNLQGLSLLGLPFFLRQGGLLSFNLTTNELQFGPTTSKRGSKILGWLFS